MYNTVFPVRGSKVATLLVDDDALRFLSVSSANADEFREKFGKKLSIAHKTTIKYDKIISIRKEVNESVIKIRRKGLFGIPGDEEFSFQKSEGYETFFRFFEKERYYTRTTRVVSSFRAASGYFFGLLFTILIFVMGFSTATDMKNGTFNDSSNSGKARTFNAIVSLLGENGVLAVGLLVGGYIAFKMWKRFSNPPDQVILSPTNRLYRQDIAATVQFSILVSAVI